MVINTNIEALITSNNLNVSSTNLARSLARLSSGSKIVRPSDDAAGLAVSNRIEAKIKRLDAAMSNVGNGVSWTQTQDGFMKEISTAFRRMSELAMLAQDATKSDADRSLYDQEFQEIKRYVLETKRQDFNGVSMFDGAALKVTIDSEGATFTTAGIDLGAYNYDNALNSGTNSYKLSQTAYRLSKDGFSVGETAYKTSTDLWRKNEWKAQSDKNIWQTSVGGSTFNTDVYKLKRDAYKLGEDLWFNSAAPTAWSTTNYDGVSNWTKYAKGSFVLKNSLGAPHNPPSTSVTDYNGGDFTTINLSTATGNLTADDFKKYDSGSFTAANTAKFKDIAASQYTALTSGKYVTAHDVKEKTSLTAVTSTDVGDTLTKAAHGLKSGDWVQFTASAPAGTALNTTYYAKSVNADTLELYTDSALTAANKVNITANGTGATLDVLTWQEDSAATVIHTNGGADVFFNTTQDVRGFSTVNSTWTNLNKDADALYTKYAKGSFVNENVTTLDTADPGATAYTNGAFVATKAAGTALASVLDAKWTTTAKGAYVSNNVISSGEDTAAVVIASGQIVSTTQNLSAFAALNSSDYTLVNVKTKDGAATALKLTNEAITQVASDRSRLGATQSRLNFTNSQLTVTKENMSAAVSRIVDVDVAEESTQYARYQILVASGTQMLKQANQLPQSAIELLR
ncbi:MAG: hypothetical protein EXS28_06850 [Pedosphaera sp.]|nr:hypothetical protein [Pedosphaera sp.]